MSAVTQSTRRPGNNQNNKNACSLKESYGAPSGQNKNHRKLLQVRQQKLDNLVKQPMTR
jgi:hypothetical protein